MRCLAPALAALVLAGVPCAAPAAAPHSAFVFPGADGKLQYRPDGKGDTIPDFSHCGYGGGCVRLPAAPVKATLAPAAAGDDTARIQAALDGVAKLPPDAAGLRGAVLLKKGRYRIEGQVRLQTGGVVLRGEGQDETGTVLVAAGKGTRHLIAVGGSRGPSEMKGSRRKIASAYVPVGARSFEVEDASPFKPGDAVIVSRQGNAAWIHEIAMDRIKPRPSDPSSTKQWGPFALGFDRIVTAVDGRRLTVDAPVACAIDARWGGGEVYRCDDRERIALAGVENLRGDCEFDPAVKKLTGKTPYFADERHAAGLVEFRSVKNGWARELTAVHFYHGAASIGGAAKWITVQDCTSLSPVSEITGGRRYPFSIGGQLCLVLRCRSVEARHAFVFGARVCGPNAFVGCRSEQDFATSEPHHRWSVGGLYDNVRADLAFQDRQYMGSGHGWAGANYVAWNCEGSLVCQTPPTAHNWAIGFVGVKKEGAFPGRPDGTWESLQAHVEPRSLYFQQLQDRLGAQALRNLNRGATP